MAAASSKQLSPSHEVSCDRETISSATIGQLRGQSKVVDIRSVKAPQERGMYLINAFEQCVIEYTYTYGWPHRIEEDIVYTCGFTRYICMYVANVMIFAAKFGGFHADVRVAISPRKTEPAISGNASFSQERCIDEIWDEKWVSGIQTKILSSCFKNILFTASSLSLSLSLYLFLSLPYL